MIAAALAEQGATIPADLLPAEVWPVAAPYREAFRVLSSSRGRNETGPMPIAYTEIISYARENGFAESITEQQEFVHFVQAQDQEYLKAVAKELDRRVKGPKAS